MRSFLVLFVWLSVFIDFTVAQGLLKSTKTDCPRACYAAITSVRFQGETDTEKVPCTNLLHAQSVYLCERRYCSTPEIEAGNKYWRATCKKAGEVAFPYGIIWKIKADQENALEVLDAQKLGDGAVYARPIIVPENAFRLAYKTTHIRTWESNMHVIYGWAVIGFWTVVIFIGILVRLLDIAATFRIRLRRAGYEKIGVRRSQKLSLLSRVRDRFKRWLEVPATFGSRCRQSFVFGTIPPRLHSLTVIAFALLNLALCCVSYETFSGNLSWPDIHTQLLRYVADRCGIMAVSNLPYIWLFGQRNNILMWMTGWEFATFNSFHRWSARVVAVQAMVHGFGYFLFEGKVGRYDAMWNEMYWKMGVTSGILIILIPVLSSYKIRRCAYEAFLALHVTLAMALLCVLYLHLGHVPRFQVYIWPCLSVWAFDRFLRVCRLLVSRTRSRQTLATATYDSSANVVHLSVPTNSIIRPRPGQHYFLYFLRGWKAWESHPFTVSSWSSDKIDSGNVLPFMSTPKTRHSADITTDASDLAQSIDQVTSIPRSLQDTKNRGGRTLNFVMRPYDGFTSRLRDAIRKTGGSSVLLPLALEGPYGSSLDLSTYDTLLFMVGGTGITVPLSYVCYLREASEALSQDIHIEWAMRQPALLDTILTADLKDNIDRFSGRMKISAYMTHRSSDDSFGSVHGHQPESCSLLKATSDIELQAATPSPIVDPSREHIQIHQGRPMISYIIGSICETAASRTGGSICVISCGPPTMSDESRKAVVRVLGSDIIGKGLQVNFIDASFGW